MHVPALEGVRSAEDRRFRTPNAGFERFRETMCVVYYSQWATDDTQDAGKLVSGALRTAGVVAAMSSASHAAQPTITLVSCLFTGDSLIDPSSHSYSSPLASPLRAHLNRSGAFGRVYKGGADVIRDIADQTMDGDHRCYVDRDDGAAFSRSAPRRRSRSGWIQNPTRAPHQHRRHARAGLRELCEGRYVSASRGFGRARRHVHPNVDVEAFGLGARIDGAGHGRLAEDDGRVLRRRLRPRAGAAAPRHGEWRVLRTLQPRSGERHDH